MSTDDDQEPASLNPAAVIYCFMGWLMKSKDAKQLLASDLNRTKVFLQIVDGYCCYQGWKIGNTEDFTAGIKPGPTSQEFKKLTKDYD